MVGQYPKECSVVFIMNLIRALFSYLTPFCQPSHHPLLHMHIELFMLQWISVTSQ